MKWVVLALALAGCDKLFLQENAPPLGSGMCGPEYVGQRYLVLTQSRTWHEAEKTCSDLEGEYSHLAVIGSPAEALEISALVAANAQPWVGLTKLGKPDFHWITREPAGIMFIPGQPDKDGDCGRMIGSTGLADSPCNDTRDVVCECDEYPVDEDRF